VEEVDTCVLLLGVGVPVILNVSVKNAFSLWNVLTFSSFHLAVWLHSRICESMQDIKLSTRYPDELSNAPAVVDYALLCATLWHLLLLLGLNLGSLRFDFAGTGERSVNCVILSLESMARIPSQHQQQERTFSHCTLIVLKGFVVVSNAEAVLVKE